MSRQVKREEVSRHGIDKQGRYYKVAKSWHYVDVDTKLCYLSYYQDDYNIPLRRWMWYELPDGTWQWVEEGKRNR